MATSAEIQAKIDKLEVNMIRLDQITNGSNTTDVTVDSGIVPSIAKFFKTIGDQAGGYVQRAEAAAIIAENAAGDYATLAALQAATVLLGRREVYVIERTTGNAGGAWWTRQASEPAVPASAKVQDASGVWFLARNEAANPKVYGARSDGTTNATSAIADTITIHGKAVLPAGGEYLVTAGSVDLRNVIGPGKIKLTNGKTIVASSLIERGEIAQRYVTEVTSATNNSVTQSIDIFNGKLYRSQQKTVAPSLSTYDYDTTVDISEYDLPAGDGRSRTSINYTSDSTAQTPNYTITVKGLGHGDGISLITEGGQTWLYGHCSSPQGSAIPDLEATGYVKFPFLGASTALEPAGAIFYRNLQNLSNPNFGLSSDGKWLLFVQRDVDAAGVKDYVSGSVTTYRVVVFERSKIEAAGPANAPNIPPFAKFVVVPSRQSDTLYAQAGITSDGTYIYITFSGARVVGKTFMDVYTISGDFVKTVITSGIRAESVDVYAYGKSGWLPAFYETEGLTVHGDKVYTSSRYLFVSGSPIVSWNGNNYVYMSGTAASGNLPTNIGYWAPTKAAATAGAYNPATVYTRGTIVFHHYITAYVEGGKYGTEEFAVDADPYNHPFVENSFNGMTSSRSDYTINYYPLNTPWVAAIASFRTSGEIYFHNGEKVVSGAHATNYGLKFAINDTDLRFQYINGLTAGAAISITSSSDSLPSNVIMYGGTTTPIVRFSTNATVFSSVVRPSVTSTGSGVGYQLGQAAFLWDVVFARSGSINTSDERQKTFAELEEAEIEAAFEIREQIKKFQFNDAITAKGPDGARWHIGVGAQTVGSIMSKHGLDPNKYGFFCYDEWDAVEEVVKDGEVIEPALEAGNGYGIRYEELLIFITNAISKNFEKRLSALENKG